MAVLNPDQGGVPASGMPDQTGASRGQIADRSLGIIAEGVGSAVKSGVDLYNDYNHWQIDTSVRKGFNDANKPYTDVLPNDLSKSSETIGALQNAYEQGKISDVYYTGQLAKLSKSLRAQYPQYEDYVDSTIQQVTGIRPANAFRNALMSEFDKQTQSAGDEAKFERQYVKENEAEIKNVFPDYFDNPSKYDFNQVQATVADYKGKKEFITKQMLDLDYLEKNNKLTADKAGETAATSLGYTVSASMTGLGNTLGINGSDLIKKIQAAGTQGFTPEENTQIMGQLGNYQLQMRSALRSQMYAPLNPQDPKSSNLFAVLGPTEAQKQIDAAMAPIDDIVKYATDSNWGMAAYYINLNKIKGDRDLNIILNASPEAATLNAFGKIDNTLAQDYLQASHENGTSNENTIFQEMTPELAARIAGGTDTVGDAATRMANSTKSDAEKAAGINSLLDANKATIISGHATPDQFKNAVLGTYGPLKNGNSVFSLIKPDEYNDLFRTMYSKEVTDSIVKSGDKDLLNTYLTSAIDQVNATPDFFKAAKAIQDVQELSKISTIEFIPGSNVLVMKTDPTALNAPAPGGYTGHFVQKMANDSEMQNTRQSIDTLNSIFGQITPMLTGMGLQPDKQGEVFQQVLKNLSVNLEAKKQDGFFDWVNKAVTTGLTNLAGGADLGKVDTSAQIDKIQTFDFNFAPVTNDPLSGDQASFKSKVSTSESGGSNTAANPNSSALGKYQIIDSTWRGLMRLDPRLTKDGRTDSGQSEIAMDLLTKNYDAILNGDNLPVTDSNRYILHFLGPVDGPEILVAPAEDPVSDYLSPRVIAANKAVLSGKTVGEVRSWASRHMS